MSSPASAVGVPDAVAVRDAATARTEVSALLSAVAQWLLAAKGRIETGGTIDG